MYALFSKDMGYCVTILIIHNHSDEAAYFTFIELTSSVPLAELLVKNFHQSVEHGHYSKASEKPLLTGSALHGCRTPKARMYELFSEDMGILCDNINNSQSQ